MNQNLNQLTYVFCKKCNEETEHTVSSKKRIRVECNDCGYESNEEK